MTALVDLPSAPAAAAALPRPRHARPSVPVLAAGAVLVLLVLVAAFPGLFTGVSPTATNPVDALTAPSGAHWLGTDELGRDEYARVVYGARPSLLIGLSATVLAVAGGALLGLAAALGGRLGDGILMRLVDVLLALPQLMLALLVITVLGPGTANTAVAVAIGLIPGYARIVRAEAQVVRRSGYVEAAVGLGLRRRAVIGRHILPNALGPLLVVATVGFGAAIITASGLSFLGLGAQPPSPEWGAMLSDGRNYLAVGWWLGVFPGAAITLSVVSINLAGRHLQARFTRRTA
jgi:peptide/nickel transport system permease protein